MSAVAALISAEGLPADYLKVVEDHWRPVAARIATEHRRPVLVGINGAQGSGKTTLCRFLEPLLAEQGLRAVTLALDDFYLTRAQRQEAAQRDHPLFATRGVPGTHDPAMIERTLDAFTAGETAVLPRFDKAADDRADHSVRIEPPIDVILFEGWCVGARPQSPEALAEPLNRLEAEEDPDGSWRMEVNRRLASDYAKLFARIDLLVMLKVESFEAVSANRALQERKLAARYPAGTALMDQAALARFLMHYERLTRWMFAEMPRRADLLIEIGADQNPR
jgi:D-glycerate 3-kinase